MCCAGVEGAGGLQVPAGGLSPQLLRVPGVREPGPGAVRTQAYNSTLTHEYIQGISLT